MHPALQGRGPKRRGNRCLTPYPKMLTSSAGPLWNLLLIMKTRPG